MTTQALSRRDRRRARALALQMLYGCDQKRFHDDGQLVILDPDEGGEPQAAVSGRAQTVFQACLERRTPIDATLERYLKNWTLDRMAITDRSILRLGAYEILYDEEVPVRVAINEYIELAKEFGSDAKTAKLVNGVLDRIAREHRGGEMNKRDQEAAGG